MLCGQCCAHVHKLLTMLDGGRVHLMAHGCDGDTCDYSLR